MGTSNPYPPIGIDFRTTTGTWGTSIALPKNAVIAGRDSADTQRSIITTDSSSANIVKIGWQTTPPAGGDLYFYQSGYNSGKFDYLGRLVLSSGSFTDAALVLFSHTSDPSGTVSAGSLYWNSSSSKVKWYNGSAWANLSGAFSDLTSATNTTAAMIVGTGASLDVSGSGTISATGFTGSPTISVTDLTVGQHTYLVGLTPGAGNGYVCYTDTTLKLTGQAGSCGTSDARAKRNIVSMSGSIDAEKIVGNLRSVFFEWEKPSKFSYGKQVGLIAQEVEVVFPEAVSTDSEGGKSVDYIKLIPLLIDAVKSLQHKVKLLERE
jgi:hypothetical protein